VPGIGEKGATNIIAQFGSIENAYEHADEISNTRNRNALLENFELAQMSKVLATINIDSPVETELKQCKFPDIYTSEALEMIKELEFKSMIPRFSKISSENDCEKNFVLIDNVFDADEVFQKAKKAECIGLYIYKKEMEGIALSYDE
jgi:DNA polymerase-1